MNLCTSLWNGTHADNDRQKKNQHNWKRTLNTCLVSNFVEFCSAVAKKKFKNVSANQRPEQQSWFSNQSEKHNLGGNKFCIDLKVS